jgi:hypothetical protein
MPPPRRQRRTARKPPETRFDQPLHEPLPHHAWTWANSEEGAVSILCDGKEVIVAEDFETALRHLGALMRSREMEA